MDLTTGGVRQRWADVALVLGCLFLTVLAVKGHWSPLPGPVIAAAGLIGSAAQWQRRRWPEAAALIGAATYPLSGNLGPLLVGLYSGASYAPRRHVWFLAIGGCAGFAGWFWIDSGRLSADNATWSVIAAAFVVAVGLYAGTRRDLTEAWRERAERADTERLLYEDQARTAERTRIAREMHDVVAHKVSLIALHAGALELTAGMSQERVEQQAALIRTTAREALGELRHVLGLLQAAPLEQGESFADLPSLVEAAVRAGQRVELRDEAGPLPPIVARVVYRVAQEGLTNARKHAPDAPATVSVQRGEEGAVTVTVRNGPAMSEPMDLPGSGAGLVGLAERVRLAGGAIHSGRSEDGGWQIYAVIPPVAAEDNR
jgi:signal transduction histidine kinase